MLSLRQTRWIESSLIPQEAYYIHFSDWPLPKPWNADIASVESNAPACPGRCDDREAWLSLYRTFQEEAAVCKPKR